MKRYLLGLIGVLLIFFVVISTFRYFWNYPVNPRDRQPVTIEVTQGLGAKKIAKLLHQKKLIRSELGFVAKVYLVGAKVKLKAGTYQFSKAESGSGIIKRMLDGDVISQEKLVTVPEGYTVREIGKRIEQAGLSTETEFVNRAKVANFRDDFEFLKDVPEGSLEGYLFPDTYKFYKDASVDDVIKKMLQRFDEQFRVAVKGTKGLQEKNFHQIVTMASIIEREVRTTADRRIVSGILWSRLESDVALAADATNRYILNKWKEPLTVDDLRIDSAYNTRNHLGLPPGPIGNPGLDTLKAAMDPEDTDFFYYISTPEGKTVFSKTLDEHNAAVAKYLK